MKVKTYKQRADAEDKLSIGTENRLMRVVKDGTRDRWFMAALVQVQKDNVWLTYTSGGRHGGGGSGFRVTRRMAARLGRELLKFAKEVK